MTIVPSERSLCLKSHESLIKEIQSRESIKIEIDQQLLEGPLIGSGFSFFRLDLSLDVRGPWDQTTTLRSCAMLVVVINGLLGSLRLKGYKKYCALPSQICPSGLQNETAQ